MAAADRSAKIHTNHSQNNYINVLITTVYPNQDLSNWSKQYEGFTCKKVPELMLGSLISIVSNDKEAEFAVPT